MSRHDSGKWEAKALVGSCSKFINLGLFDTEQQAIAAYHRAMAKMGTQGASKPAAQPASNAAMDYPAQYQQLNLSEAGQLAYAQMQAAALAAGGSAVIRCDHIGQFAFLKGSLSNRQPYANGIIMAVAAMIFADNKLQG